MSTHLRRSLVIPEAPSRVSQYEALDRYYQGMANIVHGARIAEVANQCLYELDDQIQDAAERGRSLLALGLAERNMVAFSRAAGLFIEDYVTRPVRRGHW
ncbi:hypothetical protein [Kibdelosporangium philippinense]